MKGLKNEPYLFITKLGQTLLRACHQVVTVEENLPRGGKVQAGKNGQKRALAATGRAGQSEKLASGDFEIKTSQRLHGGCPVTLISLGHGFGLQN